MPKRRIARKKLTAPPRPRSAPWGVQAGAPVSVTISQVFQPADGIPQLQKPNFQNISQVTPISNPLRIQHSDLPQIPPQALQDIGLVQDIHAAAKQRKTRSDKGVPRKKKEVIEEEEEDVI